MDIWGWMGNLVSQYGYLGALVISIFGNFTVFFPVPFTITIYIFGASLNPLLLGLVCGVGSTVGEFSAYIIGRGGRKVLDKRYGERLESIKLLIQKYGMLVIFLFALLPLPDDLILVPLGIIRYNLKKAMIAMFVGKTLMCTIIAYAGRFSYDIIREIFQSGGMLGGIATVILLVIVLLAMIRIDWTKFIDSNQKPK